MVGFAALLEGSAYLAGSHIPTLTEGFIGALTILTGASLMAGFLTPLLSTIIGLEAAGIVFSWLPPPTPNLFVELLPTVLLVVVSAAVVLLGPGAWSVDSRLFGMREIVIARPPRH
jgi:uncharacterized membrane protein YphA (DoxX/SURF4 family)